jgi:hypothetical protein
MIINERQSLSATLNKLHSFERMAIALKRNTYSTLGQRMHHPDLTAIICTPSYAATA